MRIAVVGAGAAGLGVAYALTGGDRRNVDVEDDDAEPNERDADDAAGHDVTLFERRDRPGGRMATRRHDDCVYDTGANYVKNDDERVSGLLREEFGDDLVTVDGDVWTFDADGTVSEGRGDDAPKWTDRQGISRFGDRLVAATDATLETGVRVEKLAYDADGGQWHVETDGGRRDDDGGRRNDDGGRRNDDGGRQGPWDALVLTPPAPVTASLLDQADWADDLRRDLREHVGHVPYRTVTTVALHYTFEVERPYYALVYDGGRRSGSTESGTNGEVQSHDVGWLAREECKPGHVPDGQSLLVAQMAPDWSAEWYDRSDADVAAAAADGVADLLDDHALAAPDWYDVVRWRDALPDAGADPDELARAERASLWFAGDWVAGEGRVHRALRSGLDVGERIRRSASDGA
ncbi:NAD(P)/FAD-dependent oxidoreductase [Halomicrococcus gelatinilyticus]|uniref:NAD(P)/FAD-dependent oxidoreductase n=1 Tax=Halomicrococcus gelatinilyticus TaxID=1702103 RepID=UPI002E11776A